MTPCHAGSATTDNNNKCDCLKCQSRNPEEDESHGANKVLFVQSTNSTIHDSNLSSPPIPLWLSVEDLRLSTFYFLVSRRHSDRLHAIVAHIEDTERPIFVALDSPALSHATILQSTIHRRTHRTPTSDSNVQVSRLDFLLSYLEDRTAPGIGYVRNWVVPQLYFHKLSQELPDSKQGH